MVKFLTLTYILATWVVVVFSGCAAQISPSQPPVAADCSTLILDMMDCMSFLTKGSDDTAPDASCCSGLTTVLSTDADCICYALSSSVSLGLDINMTRAEALPSDCGVSAPPIGNCNVSSTSPSPSASPANPPAPASAPPSNSPSLPPIMQPPAASPGPGGAPAAPTRTAGALAPTPSRASSGSYTAPATFAALILLGSGFFSYFYV